MSHDSRSKRTGGPTTPKKQRKGESTPPEGSSPKSNVRGETPEYDVITEDDLYKNHHSDPSTFIGHWSEYGGGRLHISHVISSIGTFAASQTYQKGSKKVYNGIVQCSYAFSNDEKEKTRNMRRAMRIVDEELLKYCSEHNIGQPRSQFIAYIRRLIGLST